ncbi:Smc5 [Ecytonucleospora hepatopenaei]|uniref:Structural maintenance of chromosomes protein 5 n=1 Tax=Ecytonucleospora hepatopenaei TaxID=646526 RepID=A0A1W0E8P7_9MICR|nr:Smc5 [Ecytonucleospora hepatopenaei]
MKTIKNTCNTNFEFDPNKIENEEFKHGNVMWLYVRNFKTFEEQEFYFGSKLNLIAAPNGAGKSSVASALGFAFCANLKTISLARRVSDLVKFGEKYAEVKVAVYTEGKNNIENLLTQTQKPEDCTSENIFEEGVKKIKSTQICGYTQPKNYVILTRKIKVINERKEEEEYYKNNEKFDGLKNYKNFVLNHLCIDVNKLTNFLGQEKVSEFARLKPEELFEHVFKGHLISHGGKKLQMDECINRYKTNICKKEAIVLELNEKSQMENNLYNKKSKLYKEIEKINKMEDFEKQKMVLTYKKELLDKKEVDNHILMEEKYIKSYELEFKKLLKDINDCNDLKKELEEDTEYKNSKTVCDKIIEENLKIKQIKNKVCMLINDIKNKKEEISIKEKENIKIKEENKKALKNKQILKEKVYSYLEKFAEFSGVKTSNLFCEIKSNLDKNLDEKDYTENISDFKRLRNLSLTKFETQNFNGEEIERLKTKAHKLQMDIENIERFRMELNDRKGRRFELLKKFHYDTYKALMLLKENPMYKSLYYEPLFLNIEIEEGYNSEIEALLSFQSLSSFLVKSSEDMFKLTTLLKDQKKLAVNFIVLDFLDAEGNICRKDSTQYIEKQQDIRAASDLIYVDEVYKTFLNLFYNFNKIPVVRNTNLDENYVFSKYSFVKKMIINKYIVESKGNKYNSDKIIKIDRLISQNIFSDRNSNLSKNLEGKLKKLKILKELREKVNLDMKKAMVEKAEKEKEFEKDKSKVSDIKMMFYNLQRFLGDFYTNSKQRQLLEIDYALLPKYEQMLLAEVATLNDIKLHTLNYERINSVENELINVQRKLQQSESDQIRKKEFLKESTNKLNVWREKSKMHENKMKQIEHAYDEQVRRNRKRATLTGNHTAKTSQQIIEETSKNNISVNICKEEVSTSQGQTFNWKKEVENCKYDSPYDIAVQINLLDTKIQQILPNINEKAKSQLIDAENRYKGTNAEKQKLKEEYNKITKNIHSIKNSIERSIQINLQNINEKFNTLLSACGFSGEVHLFEKDSKRNETNKNEENKVNAINDENTSKNEEDMQFSLYLYVKFKGKEMQRLKKELCSGGEMSISIILFILALQDENSSFRLVDEINQGMDKENEEKVFKLLNKMNGQFFIITPKLLDVFEYPENTKAHILYTI